jgi:hypothetical protein
MNKPLVCNICHQERGRYVSGEYWLRGAEQAVLTFALGY